MHLDVLSGFPEVKICTAYEFDGKRIVDFPSDQGRLNRCKPVFETFPGWKEDISEAKSWDDLPANARKFAETVERIAEVPVKILSVGRRRDQTIFRD
jgi:adenylosuccinate synthase